MRLGVDVGGTKIEVVVLEADGAERLRRRIATPQREYSAALVTLAEHVLTAEKDAGERCTVGVGMPGLIDPDTGVVANAYNTPYNGRPLKEDLEKKLEQFLSGPAKNRSRDEIGEEAAMARYEDRLARAFSLVINVLDPDVIVVGGGVSKHERLYVNVPPLLRKYVYCENPRTPIVHAMHGDASGVRGAAMLWPV